MPFTTATGVCGGEPDARRFHNIERMLDEKRKSILQHSQDITWTA